MKAIISKSKLTLSQIDWWYCGAILLIVIFGLVVQYSIEQSFTKQLVAAVLGVVFFVGLQYTNYRSLKNYAYIYYGLAIVVLIAVLLFGTTVRGTTGWFIIGSLSVQPVEIVKLLFILFVASYYDKDITQLQNLRGSIISGIHAAIICGLIFRQPDLGSAFIIFIIWFIYLLLCKSPKWFMGLVVLLTIMAVLIGWFFIFEDYQKQRLATFIAAEEDPWGAGYNVSQSIIAVGSGGFWGRGLGLGPQSQLHFLPEASSDFIFAVIAEEFGLIGVTIIFLGYAVIFWRIWRWMLVARDNFSFLVLLGVGSYLIFQAFLVVGMNIGVLPVTGVPLPLLSAGGSSMLITLIMLGIAQIIGVSQD